MEAPEGKTQDGAGTSPPEEKEAVKGEDDKVEPESLGGTVVIKRKKKRDITPPDRVNWLVHLLYSRGDFKEALRVIESQLSSCNGLCEYPLYVKGLILRQEGKVQESLELFQAATLLNPMNSDNLAEVGKSLFLLAKHKAALDVLDEAAIQNGSFESWEIMHNKGLCFSYLKNYEKAIECFEAANAIQRHDVTFTELGKMYITQNKLEEAIETFLEALEFSPENPDLLTTVGLLYLRLGENFKAFDYLGNSMTYDPKKVQTILATGSVIQDHGDMDVALVKYRVAAVKTPSCGQLWNNIGMAFFGKQRYVAAAVCLLRSIYLKPFEWLTALNLGIVYLTTGQYASSFLYLSTSINLKPDYAASYMYLAIVLSRLDDPENAIGAYEKSLSLEDDPLCHLNYAVLLHNRRETEQVRKHFTEFEKICDELGPEEAQTIKESAAVVIDKLTKLCS